MQDDDFAFGATLSSWKTISSSHAPATKIPNKRNDLPAHLRLNSALVCNDNLEGVAVFYCFRVKKILSFYSARSWRSGTANAARIPNHNQISIRWTIQKSTSRDHTYSPSSRAHSLPRCHRRSAKDRFAHHSASIKTSTTSPFDLRYLSSSLPHTSCSYSTSTPTIDPESTSRGRSASPMPSNTSSSSTMSSWRCTASPRLLPCSARSKRHYHR